MAANPATDHGAACSCDGAASARTAFAGHEFAGNEDEARAPWPHSSTDPTGTKTIRDRYEAEMYRRFRALKGAIREGVIANDAFGLSRNPRANSATFAAMSARERRNLLVETADDPHEAARDLAALADADINIEPPDAGMFAFPSDERKVREFDSWLDTQVSRGILETNRHDGRDIVSSGSWQNTYIRSSYERGVNHADAALVEQGTIPPSQMLDDVFRATSHADAAGLIYTRAYDELRGVSEAMGQQMSRELTEGITQGENPRKVARRLNGRVDNVGLHRGRLIARTETIRAHNESALNRYEDMGDRLGGVRVLAEFTSAGDDRVCPECLDLEGTRYTLRDVRGLIPVHPNCRCTFLPIQSDAAGPTPSAA